MTHRLRRADDRPRTRLDWLDGRHSFSFGDHHDPSWIRFRTLRVLNDDRVAPGGGFPTHPHADMEIVTVSLDGLLEHRDSLGSGAVLEPGMIQVMSAGTGITHSEFNPSRTESTRLLQIWILPDRKGLAPRYRDLRLNPAAARNRLAPVAGPEGSDAPAELRQDAWIFLAELDAGAEAAHPLAPGRGVWIQIATGQVEANGIRLVEGDGLGIENEPEIRLRASTRAKVVVLDLG